eukprot:185592-Rhodomonas_salina.2
MDCACVKGVCVCKRNGVCGCKGLACAVATGNGVCGCERGAAGKGCAVGNGCAELSRGIRRPSLCRPWLARSSLRCLLPPSYTRFPGTQSIGCRMTCAIFAVHIQPVWSALLTYNPPTPSPLSHSIILRGPRYPHT